MTGSCHYIQAKRHRSFGTTMLQAAIDLFLATSEADHAGWFPIANQVSLRLITVQKEIEPHTAWRGARGSHPEAFDGEDAIDLLREHLLPSDAFSERH